jgi:hypothetical protein
MDANRFFSLLISACNHAADHTWIKEGKQAVKMTRLSCHRFRCNEVRLALSLLAYQPVEPVAAVGAAAADCELITHQLAATAGEDRWPSDQACPLLLATVGREPSYAAAVWEHGAADGAAVPDWVGVAGRAN